MRLALVDPDPLLRWAPAARRWVALGLAIGLAVGAGVYFLIPPRWTATAAIELTDISPAVDLEGAGLTRDRLTVDTDAQILGSDGVVTTVAQQTGVEADGVRSALSVSARPLTRVLEISYSDASSEAALDGTRVAASAFLRERQRLVVSALQDYLAQIVVLTEDPSLSTGLLGDVAAGDLDSVSSLEIRRQQATELQLELSSAGRVVDQARLTATADRGDVEVPLVSGAALGALAGLLVGCFLASRNDRSRR